MGVFQPRYIFESELSAYGLGGSPDVQGLLSVVDTASLMIDEYCGRTDGGGDGSLVYTTYQQRVLAEAPGRNIYFLPYRPLVALTQAQVNALSGQDIAASGYYYTGVQPSINTLANGTLSAIISASGRYIPGRRDKYGFGDDAISYTSPWNLATFFGAPPQWEAVDMVNLDYDAKTGQVWIAGGLYQYRFSEVIFVYNSGYDPGNMPRGIKRACAAITKNLLAKGTGTTGMKSFTSSKIGVSAEFNEDCIDVNVQRLLDAFKVVRT